MQDVQKRTYKRFDIDGHADVKIKSDQRETLRAYLDDIGVGGCRILIPKEMDFDQDLNLALTTSFLDRPLKVRGKVKHVAPAGNYGSDYFSAGVKFTRVNARSITL